MKQTAMEKEKVTATKRLPYKVKDIDLWQLGRKEIEIAESDVASLRGRICLLYTSPSPRDRTRSRMPSSA